MRSRLHKITRAIDLRLEVNCAKRMEHSKTNSDGDNFLGRLALKTARKLSISIVSSKSAIKKQLS